MALVNANQRFPELITNPDNLQQMAFECLLFFIFILQKWEYDKLMMKDLEVGWNFSLLENWWQFIFLPYFVITTRLPQWQLGSPNDT